MIFSKSKTIVGWYKNIAQSSSWLRNIKHKGCKSSIISAIKMPDLEALPHLYPYTKQTIS
jgi:hypothetical protein